MIRDGRVRVENANNFLCYSHWAYLRSRLLHRIGGGFAVRTAPEMSAKLLGY